MRTIRSSSSGRQLSVSCSVHLLIGEARDDHDKASKDDLSAHRAAEEQIARAGGQHNRRAGREILGESVRMLDDEGD